MKSLIAAIVMVLMCTVISTAQPTIWKADKTHSNINFTVTHIMISEVTGGFNDFDATVETNGDDFATAKVEAVIKTASINTNNEGRDKHLRSDDFFNSDSFPVMTFKSKSVEQTGKSAYKIIGDLTIRNITKEVVLDAKYKGKMESKMGTRIGFKATTTINRFDYNIKWDRKMDAGGLVVGEDVDVTLQLELAKQKKEEEKKQ